MSRLHIWQIQPLRDLLVIGAAVLMVWLGNRLSVVTVPMLLALLLAYLVEPVVSRVVRRGWMTRRGCAIVIIILGVIALLGPVGIGGGFATWQGVRLAGRTVTNVDRLMQSVANPQDKELRSKLPAAWQNFRDRIVAEDSLRRQLAPLAGEWAGEEKGAAPGASKEPKASPDASGVGDTADPAADPRATPPAPSPLPDSGNTPLPDDAAKPDPGVDTAAKGAVDEDGNHTAAPSGKADKGDNSDTAHVISWAVTTLRENAAAVSRRLVSLGSGIVGSAFGVVAMFAGLFFGAFLTGFFFYFFCTGYGKVEKFWAELIPERRKTRTIELIQKMDVVIAGFVRGRLTVAAVMIVLYTVAYALIGVPAPLIVGPIMGILTIVPYASSVAAPIAMALMWLDPAGGWRGEWWWIIGGPLIVLAVAQFLDDYVLSPIIQGKATNMDTPTILFASIAGGVLAGFYGVLIAIPVAACLKILLREVFWPRFQAWTEGRVPDILPIRES